MRFVCGMKWYKDLEIRKFCSSFYYKNRFLKKQIVNAVLVMHSVYIEACTLHTQKFNFNICLWFYQFTDEVDFQHISFATKLTGQKTKRKNLSRKGQ